MGVKITGYSLKKNKKSGFSINSSRLSSISDFAAVHNSKNEITFTRVLGVSNNLTSEIKNLESSLMSDKNIFYRYVSDSFSLSPEQSLKYQKLYSLWTENGRKILNLNFINCCPSVGKYINNSLRTVTELFKRHKNTNSSMEKNFVIKIFAKLDSLVEEFKAYDGNAEIKLITSGIYKRTEYLFFYLLALSGCSVLIFQPSDDIKDEDLKLNISEEIVTGCFQNTKLEFFMDNKPLISGPDFTHPKRQHTACRPSSGSLPVSDFCAQKEKLSYSSSEKSFEELAALSESVVMIYLSESGRRTQKTASGIAISEKGYILTNFHLLCNAESISVITENSDEIYFSEKIIKYNILSDLAVIKIDKKLKPLKIYKGPKPARGQSIMAVESPEGYLNSLSTGIIAGFREINNCRWIQFTASASYESSGGALLNTRGEVIGLINNTAAKCEIKMAASYEEINQFLLGLI